MSYDANIAIVLKPIGFVRTGVPDEEIKKIRLEGVDGYIEIFEEYMDGLKGIEEFSHIIIIAYLHKVSENERKTLLVKPRRFSRIGIKLEFLPEIGVFATDSPHRPNPIAITIARLVDVERNILYVKNLDLFDGTPVLDIKPYTPDRVISDIEIPFWVAEIEKRLRRLRERPVGNI